MRSDLTEIAFVLDRSGSMNPIADDAIGGFNTFLAAQQSPPGEARLTLVLFDHEYLVPHRGVGIGAVPPLDADTYVPRGMTALLDAVGRTMDDLGARLAAMPEADRPAKVIVAILTDGQENASRDYTFAKVSAMIKHQQEKYSWEFIFLAANQDAIAAAGAISIQPKDAIAFQATPMGVRAAHDKLSAEITKRRSRKPRSSGSRPIRSRKWTRGIA
mgnify:CR=1 FL=1